MYACVYIYVYLYTGIYKMKTWVQVIRKKTPYRIEDWVCNASSLVSLLGM